MASRAPPYFYPISQPPPQAPPQPPTSIQTEPPLSAATLLVRHLPEAIPEDMLSRLFSHYGASSVRPCAAGRLRNCAFVDFRDEAMATQAQGKLNRLRLLGKVLTVERAVNPKNNHQSSVQSVKELSVPPASMLQDASIKSKNSVSCGEPIASRLGVEYPFPPHLEYEYPPPDKNILTNIVNALIAVPRFYTQVLHLMNKMNIPAPFRMALPTPPLHPPQAPASPPPSSPIAAKPKSAESSSDESEWESSEEDGVGARTAKRTRREAIVGPAIDKAVSHEAVGLKHVTLVPKEAQMIKKKNPVLQIKIIPKTTQKLVDDDQPKEHVESIEEQPEQKPFATPQEIESGKLPPEEILSLPKFKNYVAGNPASVLYIKNLAKDVVEDDFYFIFGSLFRSVEAARSNLNVDLKKEGRMRGQAFLTFPSVELAHHALNLVNGYVFKGKPIIIQFGRKSAEDRAN